MTQYLIGSNLTASSQKQIIWFFFWKKEKKKVTFGSECIFSETTVLSSLPTPNIIPLEPLLDFMSRNTYIPVAGKLKALAVRQIDSLSFGF